MSLFDELLAMTEEQRDQWLEDRVEELIQSAEPRNHLKLRAMHAKCRRLNSVIKDPYDRMRISNYRMMDKFYELNDKLQEFTNMVGDE